jgi:hypothetical protein
MKSAEISLMTNMNGVVCKNGELNKNLPKGFECACANTERKRSKKKGSLKTRSNQNYECRSINEKYAKQGLKQTKSKVEEMCNILEVKFKNDEKKLRGGEHSKLYCIAAVLIVTVNAWVHSPRQHMKTSCDRAQLLSDDEALVASVPKHDKLQRAHENEQNVPVEPSVLVVKPARQ